MEVLAPIELERAERMRRNAERMRIIIPQSTIALVAPPHQSKKRKERSDEPADAPVREAPPLTRNAGTYRPPPAHQVRTKAKAKPKSSKPTGPNQGAYALSVRFEREREKERRVLAKEAYKVRRVWRQSLAQRRSPLSCRRCSTTARSIATANATRTTRTR